jgi:hypothetical protein
MKCSFTLPLTMPCQDFLSLMKEMKKLPASISDSLELKKI